MAWMVKTAEKKYKRVKIRLERFREADRKGWSQLEGIMRKDEKWRRAGKNLRRQSIMEHDNIYGEHMSVGKYLCDVIGLLITYQEFK